MNRMLPSKPIRQLARIHLSFHQCHGWRHVRFRNFIPARFLSADYDRVPAESIDSTTSLRVIQDASSSTAHDSTSSSLPRLNSFLHFRTHTCGELRLADEGAVVRLCGWLQFKRLDKFLLLKDSYGVTQLLLKDDVRVDDGESAHHIALESVVAAEGVVAARPAKMRNPKMSTGEVEVVVDRLKVLNDCREALPFLSTSTLKHGEANEATRLVNRYLDLRMDRMQANLRFRSSLLMRVREFLHDHHGFVDVETPTLFRRTPGGAREFLVPTHKAGEFFCLPQSPQQFKQLLMVGGIDRYFQIARCYRDEGTKRDRQPEFTQLDVELSFVDRQGVKSLVENLIVYSLSRLKDDSSSFSPTAAISSTLSVPSTPFPSMTYDEAMSSYGVDKPDLRFGMKIVDVTSTLIDVEGDGDDDASGVGNGCGSNVLDDCLRAGGSVKCIKVEKGRKLFAKAEWEDVLTVRGREGGCEERTEENGEMDVEDFGASSPGAATPSSSFPSSATAVDENLVVIQVKKDATWKTSSHARFVKDSRRLRVNALLDARSDDVILMTHGDGVRLCVALGKLRLAIAKALEAKGKSVYERPFAWLWVDDFPLFLPAGDDEAEEEGERSKEGVATVDDDDRPRCPPPLESAHHPFTAPHPDDAHLLESDPLRCRGLHYDLVLNGNEIGGGSIRIHDGALQKRVLTDFLKEECDQMEHLLKALDSGAPPHGGIALGIDRLVALLVGANSIRDVIAFPKSADFKDMMSKAPAPVEKQELGYYNIAVIEKDSAS